MEKPSLLTYDNYRKYLGDWYLWMKETKPGFSYRAFSKWAGFQSPNHLLLVIKGERNVALPSIGKYFEVLKLKQTERKYFELLVKFNQAQDMPSKTEYFRELSVYWLRRGTLLKPEQYKYLTNWYYTAIREMVNLKDFKETGSWIARKLGDLVTPAQAEQAIKTLLELKLLERNKNKKLVQTSNYVTTGNEIGSIGAFLYHEQMMLLARLSLKEKASSERNLTALTFTMRKSDYDMIVSETNDFRKRLIAALQNRETIDQDEDLYQLNIHLFPINKG